MNPRIADYIQRHRATYTKDAIRQGLLRDGFDPGEVDETFRALESGVTPPTRGLSGRQWAIFLVYIVVLYGLTLLAFALTPAGVFVVPFLAIVLFVAAGISALVAALSRPLSTGVTTGLVLVFALPLALLIVLAGSCLALFAPVLFTPQAPPARSGSMEVAIEPIGFSGSGEATCQVNQNSETLSVFAASLGSVDEGEVNVSVESQTPAGFGASREAFVMISIGDVGSYANEPTADVTLRLSGQGGTVTFEDLPLTPFDDNVQTNLPRTIDGTVTWRCD